MFFTQLFHTIRPLFLALCLSFVAFSLHGQDFRPYREGGSRSFARLCMQFNNYREAKVEYRELLKHDPGNPFYIHQIARCHLHLDEDKTAAIPKLVQLTHHDSYRDEEIWYDLGLAYLYADSTHLAREALNTYLEETRRDDNRIPAQRLIEMSHNADSMMNNPVNVSIENLGPEINSPYAELFPLIVRDESRLVFTAERPENTARYITMKGRYNADIWSSRYYGRNWRRARRESGAVNTKFSEYGVCLTADGEKMLLVFDPEEGNRFLLETTYSRRAFDRPDPYSEEAINQEDHDINGAWISRNGDFILFSAKTDDGYGGFDIYISLMLPNNEWSPPRNLGPQINTKYNDAYPSLTPDEKYLIFASEGHNSMGGYDLMITPFSTDTSHQFQVRNLGYPVNTTMDDISISFTENMRHGYKTYLKPEGYGNLDIYRVTFLDTTPEYSLIQGEISLGSITEEWNTLKKDTTIPLDSLWKISPYHKVSIEATDKKTNQHHGIYKADPLTGYYTLALPPGSYKIRFKHLENKEVIELNIPDRRNIDRVVRQNIQLNEPRKKN